jgi:hypothetical protein
MKQMESHEPKKSKTLKAYLDAYEAWCGETVIGSCQNPGCANTLAKQEFQNRATLYCESCAQKLDLEWWLQWKAALDEKKPCEEMEPPDWSSDEEEVDLKKMTVDKDQESHESSQDPFQESRDSWVDRLKVWCEENDQYWKGYDNLSSMLGFTSKDKGLDQWHVLLDSNIPGLKYKSPPTVADILDQGYDFADPDVLMNESWYKALVARRERAYILSVQRNTNLKSKA